MKPFIKYPGGKSKEIPLVKKYMPKKINSYYEPFVGGASIYLELNIKDSFINDKSKDLYLFYKLVKKQDKKLKNYLEEMNNTWKLLDDTASVDLGNSEINLRFQNYLQQSLKRKSNSLLKFEKSGKNVTDQDKELIIRTARKTAYYMIIRDLYNHYKSDEQLHVAAFYYLREYCYSSMFRFSKDGFFNVPYGGRSYDLKYMDTKLNEIFSNEAKNYFSNTQICNLDFEKFLNKYELHEDDFVFLDPPYDSDFSTYDNNKFDRLEQIRLRDCLKNIKAKWMLIIKKTDFIYDLYKDFNIIEYDMNYMVSFKNRNDKDVKHLLITNYKEE